MIACINNSRKLEEVVGIWTVEKINDEKIEPNRILNFFEDTLNNILLNINSSKIGVIKTV